MRPFHAIWMGTCCMTLMTFSTAVAEPAKVAAVPKRAEIAEKYRWNLADIFTGEDQFEAAFKKVEALTGTLSALKGTLGRSSAGLLTALKTRDELQSEFDRVLVFAGLTYHEDMSLSTAQGRNDRAEALGTRVSQAASWIMPEIQSIPGATIKGWLARDADLLVYAHFLDDIERMRAHTLSAREEELLAMAGEIAAAPGNIYGRYTNTNLDFPIIKDEEGRDVQLSPARYTSFIYSRDRRVRKDAFLGLHQIYADKANTLSATLSSQVKQHMFFAKARGYPSCLAAALDGPNIPTAVYENLVTAVNKGTPALHRYVALRRKLMGLDTIHGYDLYVPMVDVPEEKIPYDDAIGTILKALQPLGAEYVATLQKSFDSRWIDVYETQNKRSGAYCWGAYKTHPYLLLNYNGTMNDRSTIAHEMGHAMHSVFTHKTQPFVYGDYATFCAEVASTVNEVILANYLLEHAKSDAERLLILQQQIDGIRTTVFRQTMFAEFEKAIHEQAEAGTPLTGDGLRKTYGDLVKKYYGPELVIEDVATAECLRIPHFYSNFYVYTYATSHCAATNIGRRILRREPGAVEGLTKFLSAGSSLYPLDVLKLAGVDMTTARPVDDTMELFNDLVGQFETLYAKVKKG